MVSIDELREIAEPCDLEVRPASVGGVEIIVSCYIVQISMQLNVEELHALNNGAVAAVLKEKVQKMSEEALECFRTISKATGIKMAPGITKSNVQLT